MSRTRRKTRSGRLARLDDWLVGREGARLARGGGVVVDLGIGAVPWTTVELADLLDVAVVGVDHDPDAIRAARPHERPGLSFVQGSFDLPDEARPALLVRAMNVLRDYRPEEVRPAHERLGAALVEGGLLVEGTCGPKGEVLCAWLVRRRGAALVREGLLLSTDFSRGFAPLMFRDRLPRDLRGAVKPGTAISAFLTEWTRAVDALGGRAAEDRFVRSAAALAARGLVDAVPEEWTDGHVVWRMTP